MPDFLESSKELLKLFKLDKQDEYFDPIELNDRKVAFSIKRKYPDDISYKPAHRKDGEPDNIVAIWVTYTHPDESRQEININKVPVGFRVSNISLYRQNHFDYDYEESESPPKESVEQSLATPMPLSLEYSNDFFFDHSRDVFIDESGNPQTGLDILDRVFSEHCDTVHWLKGLKLRLKLLFQSKGIGLLSAIEVFLIFILKKLFGRTFEDSELKSAFYRPYNKSDFKKLNENSLNILGYKASKSVIILFCTIIITGSICGISNSYLDNILSNNFLTLVNGLFLLWLLDEVVPNILFRCVNGLIILRANLSFMKLKAP